MVTSREAILHVALLLAATDESETEEALDVLRALVVRDEHRSPIERREDFDAVAAAVRRDGGTAILELSSLAVCAGVPLTDEL